MLKIQKLCGLKMLYPEIEAPLVVILGPTAVGKTDLAIRLAKRTNGEIVSADSRLFYKDMNIGTAKPSIEEIREVPHHLIDIANPDETWSLALFQQAARKIIQDIHQRGKLPFLVGGTGQYIRSVIEGWGLPIQEPDERLRLILEKWAAEIGAENIHKRLSVLDPEAARNIDYHNLRRTVRALEVIFRSGKKFSEQRLQTGSPYSLLVIGLKRNRTDLYLRIDQRIDQMIKKGFLDEVKSLVEKGYYRDLPSMSAIGYREMVSYLYNEITFDEAITNMKRATRLFVRRQANWFKETDPDIYWFDADKEIEEPIMKLIFSAHAWKIRSFD